MQFYKHLHNISATPTQQQLLDVALILAIIPHLFIIKPVMFLYLFASLLFLIFAKEIKGKHLFIFGVLGALALALSFYETFTFLGLRKLNIFVSLVISLLFVAVVLQRLSKEINFYILFSPALFLALSYFFYNTIMMLFYAITVLFIFLLLLLWHRMQSSFIAAFKMAVSLFSFSVPIIVLLFLVFPRISFETKDFGFKSSDTIRTGHDGIMHIGGDALLVPSKRVVMEVLFDEKIPPSNQLYFRGSVLYEDKTNYWAPSKDTQHYIKNKPINGATTYKVTLYPHHKKWIYFLDYPLQSPKKTNFDSDYVVSSQEPIRKIMRYDGYSKLDKNLYVDEITPRKRELALKFNALRDDKLYAYIKRIDSPNKLNELIQGFKSLELSYSLQPKGIDSKDPLDSFVFGNKEGYCVHFASTFATMARMAGIPSRIVTGFKANPNNSYENYLIVKEEDAHAWVEVYIKDIGWQRIETTQYAAKKSTQATTQIAQTEIKNPILHRINLTYMYMRYTLQSWVLDYTRSKQMQLLRTLLEDMTALLKFIGVFIVLGVIAYLLRQLSHKKPSIHPALKAILPLLKKLKKDGFEKKDSETMEHFLKRASETSKDIRLLEVSELYHKSCYGDKHKSTAALENLIKTI